MKPQGFPSYFNIPKWAIIPQLLLAVQLTVVRILQPLMSEALSWLTVSIVRGLRGLVISDKICDAFYLPNAQPAIHDRQYPWAML
jgi:hypothetical protein